MEDLKKIRLVKPSYNLKELMFFNYSIQKYVDTLIVGSNGTLKAHGTILIEKNDVFKSLLAEQEQKQLKVVNLPQFSVEVLRVIIEFMYRGDSRYIIEIEKEVKTAITYFFKKTPKCLSESDCVEIKPIVPLLILSDSDNDERCDLRRDPRNAMNQINGQQIQSKSASHKKGKLDVFKIGSKQKSKKKKEILQRHVNPFGSQMINPSTNQEELLNSINSTRVNILCHPIVRPPTAADRLCGNTEIPCSNDSQNTSTSYIFSVNITQEIAAQYRCAGTSKVLSEEATTSRSQKSLTEKRLLRKRKEIFPPEISSSKPTPKKRKRDGKKKSKKSKLSVSELLLKQPISSQTDICVICMRRVPDFLLHLNNSHCSVSRTHFLCKHCSHEFYFKSFCDQHERDCTSLIRCRCNLCKKK